MESIRIKKDIKCKWYITINDGAVNIEQPTYSLILLDPIGNKIELPYIIEDNAIVFTIPKDIQKSVGRYSASLYAILDGQNTVIDACNFLRLVNTTCEESFSSSSSTNIDIQTVEMEGKMMLGLQGDSAYQIWLKAGNIGTEDDFLNWLRTPILDAVPVIEDLGEIAEY